MKRTTAGFCAAALLLSGCSSFHPALPNAQDRLQTTRLQAAIPCGQRDNDTWQKLDACIQETSLWNHLSQFQRIANQHPNSAGHGNRDTGTAGYKASVDYVAGLMRQAGYTVTVQQYTYTASQVAGVPVFETPSHAFTFERDWYAARGSGSGDVTAPIEQPARGDGCAAGDFSGFHRGNVALIGRGNCSFQLQVENAQAADAAAAVLYTPDGPAFQARLVEPATIPVIGALSATSARELIADSRSSAIRRVHVAVRTQSVSGTDYNLIADSPYGDANHTVVVEGHLDSIYGAGMLDNASGSTTILEIALNLAKTPTVNRLRYIWFGGEELGLLGSHYYTKHLAQAQLKQLVFDVDADVTATPNFDIMVADPEFAWNVQRFPQNVVPQSRLGNDLFADFFATSGVVSRNAWFGNDGTDSNSFSLVGVPNTGILTQQECCKHAWETKLWGGFLGNYEGKIPSFNGGCVDTPDRWCDNLSNNDPFILELTSKATAFVTFSLANNAGLGR
ncbi:MAG TPA: M28 family peptidase [Candidatus Baltobacteraceae bacterium]|jgi:Zn-dependent M28 family amino/carboxypeptidase|nr:M28 family peptidase [Candidatus Baltobacteraceae bacterium]